MSNKIKVTLTGSVNGCTKTQKETVKGLGLGKRGTYKVFDKIPSVMGAIKKVNHLVDYEEI